MSRYTIYCTVEQIEKAFNLGAKIDDIETAEEMIGWLEEKGLNAQTISDSNGYWRVNFKERRSDKVILGDWRVHRKDATLAAIDAALDYLTKK